jgi:DNA-binding MarR family transcriptional regulator
MKTGTRSGASDPLDGFDATIHAPKRLRLCALLDTAGEAEFAVVQELLDVSASVLSKHVTVLMEAGYVEQRKAVRDTRQRVWLRLTRRGRHAYQRHLAALRAIVGQ